MNFYFNFVIIFNYISLSFSCIRNPYINEIVVSGLRYTNNNPILSQNDAEIMRRATLDATIIINSQGYQAENHTVFTSDGYILTMHRIPFGKYPTTRKRIPVLLIHGLSMESTQWIHNNEDSLGFILADEGYDVWLGNLRGNRYANQHLKYFKTDQEFWDFSFEESATYDLPAMIQYILLKTGRKKLFYVGHSTGTMIAFALLASKPEYNNLISGFIALGPIATLSYTTSPIINQLLNNFRVIELGNSAIGVNKMFHADPVTMNTTLYTCSRSDFFICEVILGLFGGYNPFLHYKQKMPDFASHSVAGVSLKSFTHFGQIRQSKTLARYDYGQVKNMLKYGQATPPLYDLSTVTTPIVVFYAANDPEANPIDVTLLIRNLKSVIAKELFPHPMAGKHDFHWAFASRDLIYDKVIVYLQILEELI